MRGQEVQLFRQDGQLLRALVRLLQLAEHRRSDDEVQDHQEEDGRNRFPPHDCGPGVAVIVLWGGQDHRFGREGQARFGVMGGGFGVKKVRCGH